MSLRIIISKRKTGERLLELQEDCFESIHYVYCSSLWLFIPKSHIDLVYRYVSCILGTRPFRRVLLCIG